jgi:CheY-like chemotaxis protein
MRLDTRCVLASVDKLRVGVSLRLALWSGTPAPTPLSDSGSMALCRHQPATLPHVTMIKDVVEATSIGSDGIEIVSTWAEGPKPNFPERVFAMRRSGNYGETMPGSEHKILYIEDDPIVRRLICVAFTRRGLQVRTAVNGREGLEIAFAWLPNLIVMDLMMPEMDGFETAVALRADPRTRALPIIAFSAASRPSVVERVRESGMNGLVTKSNSHSDLVYTIRAYLPSDQLWPRL